MKLGLTASIAMMLVLAAAAPSQAGFDLSIGNVSVNGTGGAFTVFATATGQSESVSAYTLRLNLTGSSAGELPVTFTEGPGAAPGFIPLDLIPNNVIAALNGNQTTGNTIGFATTVIGGAQSFALGTPVGVGTFTFTTANGFNPGDFVDVGFVIGAPGDPTRTTDTYFAVNGNEIPINAVGGGGATVAASTRIAAVPEPSMFGLLGLVGAGLGLRRKRPVAA